MVEDEIILVNGILPNVYDVLVKKAIEYALLSKPFTIRRIEKQSIEQAVLNIFKGKLAECLCAYFFEANNILADWESQSTPFWQIDNKDFILNDQPWDLKNNFIYHEGSLLQNYNYTDLPALVPNRHAYDQWALKTSGGQHSSFLFSYLQQSTLENGERTEPFCSLHLSKEQINLLDQLEKKYKGLPQKNEPYSSERFMKGMAARGDDDCIRMHYYPTLVITGYANENHWETFKDTGKFDLSDNFSDHKLPNWYTKSSKGSINFLKNTLWTTITNATLPIGQLPSFLSLFPHLKNEIKLGDLKKSNS